MCRAVMRVRVGRGKYKQVYEKCPDHPSLKLREDDGCPKCGLRGFETLGEEFAILRKRRRRKTIPTT